MTQVIAKHEKKIQIIKALHNCLLKKPFNQTSIKDIANEAGLNHGLIHYYFNKKDDILLEYVDYMSEFYLSLLHDWIESIMLNQSTDVDIKKETLMFMNDIITTSNNEFSKILLEIWGIASYNNNVRQKLEKTYSDWEQGINKVIKKFQTDDETANFISKIWLTFAEGLILFSTIREQNEKERLELLEKLFYFIS
ncbi:MULTISPECIES: TetR/AcrR family transcriptional regulator [Psychrilyobacter]|uniref:TetR family transcriptional regulator n=1 Tax=Psychrilyobacter piezotolerans TaxID=2293438 RepID=A0ABX9KFF5_9FUSO|nr:MULTISPECIES: TetR/AcrR family transcriptional regulator [Psychrilyobacter]MCS5422155.1 TetR/AcrR family transcriptional regulator [Psychrilyobacter sp. S5]NDI78441.1 TetR/AcrR family transcriptional regulator [Psychrilyobacter piezotolerans]RDE60625.1 TetR/AcrR family transcriptional regulator [Psychrilyobacter sp. S5]REI40552.1 TetR family transcriptional regulator [Psychrilyobacter piezotolerans]